MVTSTPVDEGGLHQQLDPSIDLLETIFTPLLAFCYPLFMINTASTLAIGKPAYLHTLLGFVEPKPNATF